MGVDLASDGPPLLPPSPLTPRPPPLDLVSDMAGTPGSETWLSCAHSQFIIPVSSQVNVIVALANPEVQSGPSLLQPRLPPPPPQPRSEAIPTNTQRWRPWRSGHDWCGKVC